MKTFAAFFIIFTTAFLCGCVTNLSADISGAKESAEPIASGGGSAQLSYLYAEPFDKETYEYYFGKSVVLSDLGEVRGTILPHHLVGGHIPAAFFSYIAKQKPPLIIFFGPNHYRLGNADIIATSRDWLTPYGTMETDRAIIRRLEADGLIKIDEEVMAGEYSISSLISFAAKSVPETRVVSFIFPYFAATSTLNAFYESLSQLVPQGTVIVSSIDFSHYQNPAVAAFHDELNLSAARGTDIQRISKMEIDSPPSLYLLDKFMISWGTRKIAYEMSNNSADIIGRQDLDEITSYYSPFFVSGPVQTENTASLLFFGDIMLDRNVRKQIDSFGSDYILGKLAGDENRFFMGMDAIVANLEGPFADYRRQTSKEIAFRFDPTLLPMLKKYNFGIFSQANNHSLDMGSAGFVESIKNLTDYGFDCFGSQYRVDSESLLTKKIGDYSVAFIGLNDTNSPLNLDSVVSLIRKADESADFIVVSIHWGTEYRQSSDSREQALAHEMIDAGADAIIGHHPHVVQEMEIYKGRPIFYSLGNFIFDQYFSVPTQQSLAIGMIFKKKSVKVYIFPLEQNNSRVAQMSYASRTAYLNEWLSRSRLNGQKYSNYSLEIFYQ